MASFQRNNSILLLRPLLFFTVVLTVLSLSHSHFLPVPHPHPHPRPHFTAATRDKITPTQPLADNETLVSAGGTFALGFFTPNNSGDRRRYIGIWYNLNSDSRSNGIDQRIVLWVANRASPITRSAGQLSVAANGAITITNRETSTVVWSVFTNSTGLSNPVVELLETGNFVLREEGDSTQNYLWQSFDYPTDTLLPDMKLGVDKAAAGVNRNLTAWKSEDDPSPGEYCAALVIGDNNSPEMYLFNRSSKLWRSGPWDGIQLGDLKNWNSNGFAYSFVNNHKEVAFSYQASGQTFLPSLQVTNSGKIYMIIWSSEDGGNWKLLWETPASPCDNIGWCGSYAICVDSTNSPTICRCLEGFVPKNPAHWESRDYNDGCVRVVGLDCRKQTDTDTDTDTFLAVKGVKLPESSISSVNPTSNLDECRSECSKNCPCAAYAVTSVGGAGCVIWVTPLLDVVQLSGGAGQDLYIRNGSAHTESFSAENKLGQGGFGPVYKGTLDGDKEIAVKRLAKSSQQGAKEFKNEVTLIAKLQNRNLVQLLGCCIHGEERMLIYEYMSNKSLDTFLFEKEKAALVEWQTRYQIIVGITRGLLYLHHDSRYRIIHRDLKASNILLDKEMNPKFLDFGMARLFGGDVTDYNTRKVVGTYGYMSPEYAMEGIYSLKSDVYSFGVLLLEIISGRKNRGPYAFSQHLNLVAHAWSLWNEGKILELVDEAINNNFPMNDVLKCIKIGLLCVQDNSDDRPLMSSVIEMLGADIASLRQPKQPGFLARMDHEFGHISSSKDSRMANELTAIYA